MLYRAFHAQKVMACLKLLPSVAFEVMWHFDPTLVGTEKGYGKDERFPLASNTMAGALWAHSVPHGYAAYTSPRYIWSVEQNLPLLCVFCQSASPDHSNEPDLASATHHVCECPAPRLLHPRPCPRWCQRAEPAAVAPPHPQRPCAALPCAGRASAIAALLRLCPEVFTVLRSAPSYTSASLGTVPLIACHTLSSLENIFLLAEGSFPLAVLWAVWWAPRGTFLLTGRAQEAPHDGRCSPAALYSGSTTSPRCADRLFLQPKAIQHRTVPHEPERLVTEEVAGERAGEGTN